MTTQAQIDVAAAALAAVRDHFNAAAASFNLAAAAMNDGRVALTAVALDPAFSITGLNAVVGAANLAGPRVRALIDVVAALVADVVTPPPPTGTANPWVSLRLPTQPGAITLCAASYVNADGKGGGGKHCTMLHCPVNGKMYVFGGDYSGYASAESKAANRGPDDYRNEVFSYDAGSNVWKLEADYDVPDGQIHPWRPDWGKYAWDSKRNVFWFHRGGSSGALLNSGSFPFTGSTGLSWNYGAGRVMPDATKVAAGTLTLPDNATSYVEYDPSLHAVAFNPTGFSGDPRIPLYAVTTAGGVVTSSETHRPYWLAWGDPNDNVDPRHYGEPNHLLTLDPLTMLWTDPGLATVEEQIPKRNNVKGTGDTYSSTFRTMGMLYDPVGDQLITIGQTFALHYSIANNAWTIYDKPGAQIMMLMNRLAFDEQTRLVHMLVPVGATTATLPEAWWWTYNVDTHAWAQVCRVDNQQGMGLWDPYIGVPVGSPQGSATPMLDRAREIIWWVEVRNEYLNPYAYGSDGWVDRIHAYHYAENRDEVINAPFPEGDHPHGLIYGFDPVKDTIMCYGQNSPATDPKSSLYPQENPVVSHPCIYTWKPSGYTKLTWSKTP